MPSFAALKLIGYGVAALAVIALLAMVNGWRVHASERKAELASICAATRTAANNPKLDCKQASAQIGQLGQTIGTLTTALSKQNAAVTAMGAESRRQQAEAERAVSSAAERARKAEAASDRLASSAAHSASSGLPGACEPSKVLEEAWK